MYYGNPTKGVEFFHLLYENEEFCSELGKVSLAAGRLEATLIKFLRLKGVIDNLEKSTLGRLIRVAKCNKHISQNTFTSLDMLCKQRNYLTHNIYALFIELIDETILEREGLLDSDIHMFIDRAWQLNENLNSMILLFEKDIQLIKINEGAS